MPDIDFNERCPDCQKMRQRRVTGVARRAGLVGGAATAAWSMLHPATSPEGQWYAVAAVPVVAVLVYKIAGRVAGEILR